MKQITTLKQLKRACKDTCVELNLTKRWEEGIEHHPKSASIVHAISAIDNVCASNYFDWRVGGDGDNGETLMYQLDVVFELEDKGYTVTRDAWR